MILFSQGFFIIAIFYLLLQPTVQQQQQPQLPSNPSHPNNSSYNPMYNALQIPFTDSAYFSPRRSMPEIKPAKNGMLKRNSYQEESKFNVSLQSKLLTYLLVKTENIGSFPEPQYNRLCSNDGITFIVWNLKLTKGYCCCRKPMYFKKEKIITTYSITTFVHISLYYCYFSKVLLQNFRERTIT